MVERYAREEMSAIWSLQAKYEAWLEVEKSAIKAWHKLGLVPKEDAQKIIKNASFNLQEIDEIEAQTKHDLIAFTTSVANSLGEESRWFHYSLTSSDTIDTANALLITRSLKLIIKQAKALKLAIKKRAIKHKNTIMVGRSHGINGEPITFGLVLAVWYEEIKRHIKTLKDAQKTIAVGKLSGAMGNFAHSPLELEELVCKDLGLKPALVSNQIIQRDRYAKVACALALLASSIEKFAVEIRHLQRTEVYEAEEFFGKNQKGSSAMPHKKNPILSENITGLARVVRGFTIPALENVALWHQRDISHSSVERFWLPDAFITTDFLLFRTTNLIQNLNILPKNMQKNLDQTGGLVFSQRLLLELTQKGVKREEAYKIVQTNAMKVWAEIQNGKSPKTSNNESLFLSLLLQDKALEKHMKKQEIKDCFNYDYYLKNVDKIFERVFKNKEK